MKNLKKYWFNTPDKVRFLIIGSFNALFSYFLYSLMLFILGIKFYQFALFLSWVLSSFISFYLQRNLVFKVKGSIIKQYLKCCLTWFFSYLINALFLKLFVQHLNLNAYLAQIFANLIAAIFTYIFFKKFAFKS